MKRVLLISALLSTILGCTSKAKYQIPGTATRIPKVVILTTSKDGRGTLPSGVTVAMETFTQVGAFVRIHNKDILYDPEVLSAYSVMFVPTIFGYHDGDRRFSLAYMDNIMLRNLTAWVKNGGFLIAGENIGRNTLTGLDLVSSDERLNKKEWPLAHVFGYDMIERNLDGFALLKTQEEPTLFSGYSEVMVPAFEKPEWILIPDTLSISEEVAVLAEWGNDSLRFPGITLHSYGQGFGLYIPFFRLLHPSIDGGFGDIPEIQALCRGIYDYITGCSGDKTFSINPWPSGKIAAFAVTMDDGGTIEEYKRTLLRIFEVPMVKDLDFFVCNNINASIDSTDILGYLKSDKRIILANHSFSHPFFPRIGFTQTTTEIASFEDCVGKTRGFRFPYVAWSTYGLFVLDRRNYTYDSSIRIDHRDMFKGTLFPYHIPIYLKGHYYLTTDLLELSPTEGDWFFYGEGILSNLPYRDEKQEKDAAAYYRYLKNTWQEIVRPGRGMMVQMGHPMYQGHSNITLDPLIRFLREVDQEQVTWTTGLNDIADWWLGLLDVEAWCKWSGNTLKLGFINPGKAPLYGFSIRIPANGAVPKVKAKYVKIRKEIREEEEGKFVYIIFDLKDRATLEVEL
jgi:peptidoglycan/xylan/chitin deacetylase (PgdA/CDA1 family)